MRVEVVPATTADVIAFRSYPPLYRMLKVDGEPAAIASIFDAYGRTWATLDVKPELLRGANRRLIREIYRALMEHGGPVHVVCDAERYVTAERLLDVLRFTPTSETYDGKRVWLWASIP